MTKKDILLKQKNAENAPLTDYIGTDGYVWKMVENAMEEYHQHKLKLLDIANVVNQRDLLIAFFDTITTDEFEQDDTETIVDRFLSSNLTKFELK